MPAVGVKPELGGGNPERQAANQSGGPADIAPPDLDRSLGDLSREVGRDPVATRHVRYEAPIRIDLRVARTEPPFRRGISDRPAGAGPALEYEAHHVPSASRGRGRLDCQRHNRIW